MGIDIYLRWDGMTKGETDAQYVAWGVSAGHVGYLREPYHGTPYATRVLVPEAFAREGPDGTTDEDYASPDYGYVRIPAATLEQRLSETLATAKRRMFAIYNQRPGEADCERVLQSYRDFVSLAREKESAGLNPRVRASW